MQHNSTTWRRLPVIAAALMLLFSVRAFGQQSFSISSDSVLMQAAIGQSVEGSIELFDNDSTNPQTITVGVYLTGSSEITLLTDTIIELRGTADILLSFTPTNSTPATAKVEISGGNVHSSVSVVGTVLSHVGIGIGFSDYNLKIGEEQCNAFTVSNPNVDSIWVTNVELLDTLTGDVHWSLTNVRSLPAGIAGDAIDSIGQLCALAASYDSGNWGHLRIVYNYGTGIDSATIQFSARIQAPNTTCVTVSGDGDFGAVAGGHSVTRLFTLTNITDSSVYLDGTNMSGSGFTVNSPTFPLVLPKDSTVSLSITFTVPVNPSNQYFSGEFQANITGTSPDNLPCTSLDIGFSGSWFLPTDDTITLDVPPSDDTLSIATHDTSSTHAIFIHNSDTSVIELISLLYDNTNPYGTFQSDYPSMEFGDSVFLEQGNTIGPYVLTIRADTGTYALDFTLNYSVQGTSRKKQITSDPSYHYTVLMHVLPSVVESVSEPTQASVSFALMPNPAEGNVTIMLPDGPASTIEIYDVLGNLIWHGEGSGELSWNGEGAIASGAYIVRVTSKSTDGSIAISSKQLIFEH